MKEEGKQEDGREGMKGQEDGGREEMQKYS